MLNGSANSLQSCEAKPPPPPLAPASAADLVACALFFESFFDSFSILHFSHNCTKTPLKGGQQKRHKSKKSVKDHSSNLAWKSCLQKGPPKCENHIPFKVLSLFPRFPGTPKSFPKLDPECKLKLQNVRKWRTGKND